MKLNLRYVMLVALTASSSFGFSQSETAPFANPNAGTFTPTKAPFDVQLNTDIGSTGSVGYNGLAGICKVGPTFWVSAWATNRIQILNLDGTLIIDTVVAGVTGTRSITTDGTNVYLGTASTSIYVVNPLTFTSTSTITISTSSNAEARMCSYDPTLNSGAGGFWIGDFGSDIASVSMSGAELSVIPAATHGLTIYGGAIDNITPGGPYLWIHDQSATAPTNDRVIMITTAGFATGSLFDYSTIQSSSTTSVLSGGLWLGTGVSGAPSIVGVSQASPSNYLFAVELPATLTSLNELNLEGLNVYPNPAKDLVNISTNEAGAKDVVVYDISGKVVLKETILSNELSVSGLNAGHYIVKVSQNGKSATKKLAIN